MSGGFPPHCTGFGKAGPPSARVGSVGLLVTLTRSLFCPFCLHPSVKLDKLRYLSPCCGSKTAVSNASCCVQFPLCWVRPQACGRVVSCEVVFPLIKSSSRPLRTPCPVSLQLPLSWVAILVVPAWPSSITVPCHAFSVSCKQRVLGLTSFSQLVRGFYLGGVMCCGFLPSPVHSLRVQL